MSAEPSEEDGKVRKPLRRGNQTQTTLLLPSDLLDTVDRTAKKERRSRSNFVRVALEAYIEASERDEQ